VHRGQIALDANKLDEAKSEFEKALSIDPSSFIAQQELRRTLQMIQEGRTRSHRLPRGHLGIAQAALEGARPCATRSHLQRAITLKMTEKSNVIYETVGKLAGVNVLFDPDYTARQVRIELNGVSLEERSPSFHFRRRRSGGR